MVSRRTFLKTGALKEFTGLVFKSEFYHPSELLAMNRSLKGRPIEPRIELDHGGSISHVRWSECSRGNLDQ
jgi:hypothetical protein